MTSPPSAGSCSTRKPIQASATTSPRTSQRSSQELVALWWAEAGKYGALPLESRDAIGILLAPRPQLSKPRDRYIYYPDCAEVPESVTPNIRNRSYAIARRGEHRHAGGQRRPVLAGIAVRRPRPLHEGRQVQVRLQLGRRVRADHRVEQADPDRRARARRLLREGRRRRCRPRERSRLYLDDEKIGEGKIKTQPGKFSLAGEGLNVGKEGAEPVTDDYPGTSPWAFVGGTIHQATIDVAGEPWVDLEQRAGRRVRARLTAVCRGRDVTRPLLLSNVAR